MNMANYLNSEWLMVAVASLKELDVFGAADRRERVVDLERNRFEHETHRAVGVGEVKPAGMPAAEGVAVRPILVVGHAQGGNGDAGVGRDGAGGSAAVGIGPGVPDDELRHILADHEGVASAVRDPIQPQTAEAGITPPENAVATFETIVRAVGSDVAVG